MPRTTCALVDGGFCFFINRCLRVARVHSDQTRIRMSRVFLCIEFLRIFSARAFCRGITVDVPEVFSGKMSECDTELECTVAV